MTSSLTHMGCFELRSSRVDIKLSSQAPQGQLREQLATLDMPRDNMPSCRQPHDNDSCDEDSGPFRMSVINSSLKYCPFGRPPSNQHRFAAVCISGVSKLLARALELRINLVGLFVRGSAGSAFRQGSFRPLVSELTSVSQRAPLFAESKQHTILTLPLLHLLLPIS